MEISKRDRGNMFVVWANFRYILFVLCGFLGILGYRSGSESFKTFVKSAYSTNSALSSADWAPSSANSAD